MIKDIKKAYNNLIKFLASGLGLGLLPKAPGTWGSLWGPVIFYLYRAKPQIWFIKVSVVVTIISIIIAYLGEKAFRGKDAQQIVVDEIAGILICYSFVGYSIPNLVLGFIFFRLFDVAKIFPADWCQNKLKGGLGVVMDDVVAGLQGGALLYLLPKIYLWVKSAIAYMN